MDFFMAALSRNERFLFTLVYNLSSRFFFFKIEKGRGETAYFHGRRPMDFLRQFVEKNNVILKPQRESFGQRNG